jgi:hypothetical protein
MSDQYYLKWKNRQFGPFTQEEIAAKMRQGAVTVHHLVSVDKVSWKGMRETFPDLFPKAHVEPVSAGAHPPPLLRIPTMRRTVVPDFKFGARSLPLMSPLSSPSRLIRRKEPDDQTFYREPEGISYHRPDRIPLRKP